MEIEVGQIFDLALRKTLSSVGPFTPGSTVTFDIEVFNQGTLDAYDVQVADYIPTGMTLADANWSDADANGVADLVTPIAMLGAQSSTMVSITFTIDNEFQGTSLVNHAEVSFATDTDGSGVNTADIDSQADDTDDDFIGADDELNNNGGDEDDHDLAEIPVDQIFDLALINTLNAGTPGSFEPGSTVTFDMTVTNQGTVDAYDIEVTNYIPAGLTLADSDWTIVGGNAMLSNEIPFLAPGEDAMVSITYVIDEDFQGNTITDWAEISFATDTDGSATNTTDIDSQADGVNFNQTGETNDLADDNINNQDGTMGGDEDDHDPVQITVDQVFDLALSEVYSSFIDNDGDGQISPGDDVTFTITAFNQGTLDATNVEVTDYIPADMIFTGSTGWTGSSTAPVYTIPSLPAGTSSSFDITMTIDPTFTGTEIVNWAEISNDNAPTGYADIDSEPDAINFNQAGETDDLNDDNVVDENGLTGGDEDDHDPALVTVGQVFDLALTKMLNTTATPGPFAPESTVTFDIEVFNQGTLEAFDVQVADYIPEGLSLADANWSDIDGDGTAEMLTPIANIPAGSSEVVSISFTIDSDFQGTSIINFAEISFATDTNGSGVNTPDADSNADDTQDDFVGGDNETGNNGGDEDDHDPAEIAVEQTFDLALINTLSAGTPGSFTPGSTVTFDMTVSNQGTVDAYDIDVTNYIPAGLTLADPNWTIVGGNAVLLNEIPYLASGDDAVVSITYVIDESFQGNTITNWAEISFATDTDGGTTNTTDVDSEADGVNFNQTGETNDLADDNINNQNGNAGGDEDDHDPVQISVDQVFDLALSKAYSSFIDNDNNGAISPGDDVTFSITVFNQGTLDASAVEITDYVPTDMTFDVALNPGWSATATTSIASIPAGGSASVNVVLTIDPAFQGTDITNWAEISNDLSLIHI